MIAVAIDGPAGAGKSTAARAVAKRLGFIYVDTGAMYRAVGCRMRALGIASGETERVEQALDGLEIAIRFLDGEQHVLVNGEDVTGSIRTPDASRAASEFSALPCVRRFLFDLQQELAKKNHVIMDGRDIGTVVLPWAQVKVFLTASPEERAQRRFEELQAKGEKVGYDEILADMKERDYQDSHREIAPLRPAPDAVQLDSTGLTLDEVVERIASLVEAKREANA